MSTKSSSEQYMRVQVMRNRRSKRIIYLECGKDFADLLLTLLTLPVGKILKLLASSEAGVGIGIRPGIFNLHSSLGDLEQTLLNVQKVVLTDPKAPCSPNLLCLSNGAAAAETCVNPHCTNVTVFNGQLCDDCEYVIYYTCNPCNESYGYNGYNSESSFITGLMSNNCGHPDVTQLAVVGKKRHNQSASGSKASVSLNQGFAKETVTFMIKEDLSIVKSSTITSMSLLKINGIKSFEDLETEEMYVGRNEGLLLVRAALQSARPLTEVFEPMFQRVHSEQQSRDYDYADENS